MGLFRDDVAVWRLPHAVVRGREGGPRRARRGKAPLPLVMLHGLGADLDEFAQVWEPLSEHRRCLAFDHPGFGPLAPADSRGVSAAHMAHNAALVIRGKIPTGQVDLLAASMGGMVALELMARHPGLVRRAVLVAPAGAWPPLPAAEALLRGVAALAPLAPTQLILLTSMLLGHLRNPVPQGEDPALWRRFFFDRHGRLGQTPYARHLLATLGLMLGQSALPAARRVTCPVLLVWGDRDGTVPYAHAARYLAALPQGELLTLKGADHNLCSSFHHLLTPAALDFLDR